MVCKLLFMEALDKAIKHFGSATELGKQLGLSPAAVTNWKARGVVPAKIAKRIEEVTDGAVTRHELAPDVFN